jgi:hypothetical protein
MVLMSSVYNTYAEDSIPIKKNAEEMKTEKGTQQPSQKEFESAVNDLGGFTYIICRSFEQFQEEIQKLIPIE